MITHQVAMALCGFIAAVVVGGAALTAPVAQAARTSNDEKFVLKDTTATCKAEAKEKKINSWLAGRRFVNNCVAKVVKLTPTELQRTAVKQAIIACKAEAKGKKIRWPASRKYIKNCITTALKEHPTINISELHRGLNIKSLPVQQQPEWGCDVMTSGTGC